MRFVLLFMFLASCATKPVSDSHWNQCEKGCGLRGVDEACVTFVRGPACSCLDGFTFWLDNEAPEEYEIDIKGL